MVKLVTNAPTTLYRKLRARGSYSMVKTEIVLPAGTELQRKNPEHYPFERELILFYKVMYMGTTHYIRVEETSLGDN